MTATNSAIKDSKRISEYTPVQPQKVRGGFRGFGAEFRLMIAGQPLLWKIVCLLGIVSCFFIDLGIVQTYIIPLLMLWFIGVLSAMGSREYQHDVLKIIATVPHGRFRQIVFSWLSGFLMTLTLVIPVALRMLFASQIDSVLACLAGVVFLPSFALFFGEFTKTRRAFELVFIVMTYFIINKVPTFMYMGIHPDMVSLERSGIYLAAGVIIAVAAGIKRNISRAV
jgi:hypothetical protein